MSTKEEDTVVLLTPTEQQGETREELSSLKRRPFMASGISASVLCGIGLFITNIAIWCRDPIAVCRDSEIFRFSVLFGGILSSLLVGQAIDYYGRRSSLVSSAFCWVLAIAFLTCVPSETEQLANPYDAPMSYPLLWPSEHGPSSLEFVPAHGVNAFETQASVSHLISYSFPQNYSHGNLPLTTQPDPSKSVSFHSYGSYLNAAQKTSSNLSFGNFPPSKDAVSEYSRIKPLSGVENLNTKSTLFIPLLFSHIFIGAASAASVVAASVYVCETSPNASQARWISLSDLLSSFLILCLPIIHQHWIFLASFACLPMIILSFLVLLPFNIPDCFSLPQSPHYLLLSYFISKRIDHSKSSSSPRKDDTSKPPSSFHKCTGDMTLEYVKAPFKQAQIRIHGISSKSSASDSEESSCFVNDKERHVVLKSKLEHIPPVKFESEDWIGSSHQKKSQHEFCEGHHDMSYSVSVENFGGTLKNVVGNTMHHKYSEESLSPSNGSVGEGEAQWCEQRLHESNETLLEQQEESAAFIQQSWCDSYSSGLSWQETESLRILTFLNGNGEGHKEWADIKQTLKADVIGTKYPSKKSFFDFDVLGFRSSLYFVIKIGVPIIIIHMCSCEYGTVVTLSEVILSNMGFCNLPAPALVTFLQVISTGASVMMLDKLKNQVIFKSAAVGLTTSLVLLWVLLPFIQDLGDDLQSPTSMDLVTSNTAFPTLYPLLPTPLPQILPGKENICSRNFVKGSQLHIWDPAGITQNGQTYLDIPVNSPAIWLSAVTLVLYVLVSSFILLPLARLVLVSCFPTDRRGRGVGIAISIQWTLRLILFFFPHSFLNSDLRLLFYAIASFSSVIMLFITSSKNLSRDNFFQQRRSEKRFSFYFSYGKVRNLSTINSTVV